MDGGAIAFHRKGKRRGQPAGDVCCKTRTRENASWFAANALKKARGAQARFRVDTFATSNERGLGVELLRYKAEGLHGRGDQDDVCVQDRLLNGGCDLDMFREAVARKSCGGTAGQAPPPYLCRTGQRHGEGRSESACPQDRDHAFAPFFPLPIRGACV